MRAWLLSALLVFAWSPSSAAAAPPGSFGLLADSLNFLVQGGMAQADVSLLATSLDRGDTLAAWNPAARLIPGSNLKLFTTGAYLRAVSERTASAAAGASVPVTPATRVYAWGKVKVDKKSSGIQLKGSLILQGCGMPDVYQLLHPGSRGLIDSLAALLRSGGLQAFDGTLWVDAGVFAPDPYGPGWAYDDLVYSYAAPVGALMANGNAASVVGTFVGRGAALSLDPPETPLILRGSATVVDSSTPGRLSVSRDLGSRVVEVSGTVPRGGTVRRQIAVPEPDSAAGLVLVGAMRRAGIQVKGVVRVLSRGGRTVGVPPFALSTEVPADSGWSRVDRDRASMVLSLAPPPVGDIVGIVNAMSLNIEAEALLRRLDVGYPKTREGGLAVVRRLAHAAGIDTLDLSLVDGSGLSPMDLVTSRALVAWLASFAADSTLGPMFRAGLARPGGLGTLKHRFAAMQGDSLLQAKTGTLTNVSALSGYLTTVEGERLVFAMLSNGNRGSVDAAHAAEERLVTILSQFRRPAPYGPPFPIPR